MTVLTWDSDPVSDGLERVVLFPPGTPGVPWNGVTVVSPQASGSSTTLYFDGQAFANYVEEGSFEANIEAFTYPDAFEPFERHPHPSFGLSWRETQSESYLIHLVWGATAAPTSKKSQTRSGDIDLSVFSWDISTKDIDFDGYWPVSHIVMDAGAMPPAALAILEGVLYGNDIVDSYLPLPQEILGILRAFPHVKITDNGDGTWTAEGDEDHIRYLAGDVVEIESGAVEFIDADTYTITTW